MSPPLSRQHSIDVEYEPGSTAGCSPLIPFFLRLTPSSGHCLALHCRHTCQHGPSHSRHEEEQKSTIGSFPPLVDCAPSWVPAQSEVFDLPGLLRRDWCIRERPRACSGPRASQWIPERWRGEKALRRFTEKNSGGGIGERKAFGFCASVSKVTFFSILNLLTVALWVSEETAPLPRSFSTLMQPSVTSTLNWKGFHGLSRSHRATSQIFFVCFFIHQSGRQTLSKLGWSQTLSISKGSHWLRINPANWMHCGDTHPHGLLQKVSPWLKHCDFKVCQIAGSLKGIRVESWGNWTTVTMPTDPHLQVSVRKE